MKLRAPLVAFAFSLCAFSLPFAGKATRPKSPTMGWSSWNTYRIHISDSLIVRQARALRELGLDTLGYDFVNIDDGYFGGRDAGGNLLTHPERFPRGLKPTVDSIHSLGLKAGIYSDAGENTCGNFWDKDSLGRGVGLYGHDRTDGAMFFDSLGFDFIKIDFCGGDARQNTDSLGLDERARYTSIRRAIDDTGRQDVRINVCRWAFPGTWVHGVGDSWRISPDIAPRWNSVKAIINRNRFLSAYASPGHFNDMDMLEIGRGLSPEEERTHFGMWCMMSSPLLIGCDLTAIPEGSLLLISDSRLIALNQDTLGIQAAPVWTRDGVTLWVKDVERRDSTLRAVALANLSDREVTVRVNPVADLLLEGPCQVRELTGEANPHHASGTWTVMVGAHDTRIFHVEGTSRAEQTVYEAENAWLEGYSEIKRVDGPMARAVTDESCSGGGKVVCVGGTPGNWLEWRRVVSKGGGVYRLSFEGEWTGECRPEITVNGGKPVPLTGDGAEVRLKPGPNRIRLQTSTGTAMETLDVMTLIRHPSE